MIVLQKTKINVWRSFVEAVSNCKLRVTCEENVVISRLSHLTIESQFLTLMTIAYNSVCG